MIVGLGILVVPGTQTEAVGPSLSVSPGVVVGGGEVRLSGSLFPARSTVRIALDGTTGLFPTVNVGGNGSFRTRLALYNAAPGAHLLTAEVSSSASARRAAAASWQAVASIGVTVMPEATPDPTATVEPTPPPTPEPTPRPTPKPTPEPTPVPATPVPATPVPATPPPPPPPDPGPELTFSAEFNGGLGAFAHDGQWGCGFGYQSEFLGNLSQVSVANGVATITATKKSTPCGKTWASAAMSTRGRFAQAYGYFEARIRYDAGNGLWPAFWMNPADGSWPPEIDIMEAYPNTNVWPGLTRTYSTLHYGSQNATHEVITDAGYSLAGGWHRYGVEWREGRLTFFLDGVRTGTITQNVPSKPFYLILNFAVGNWSANADGSTPDGAQMQIDWVRVYR